MLTLFIVTKMPQKILVVLTRANFPLITMLLEHEADPSLLHALRT